MATIDCLKNGHVLNMWESKPILNKEYMHNYLNRLLNHKLNEISTVLKVIVYHSMNHSMNCDMIKREHRYYRDATIQIQTGDVAVAIVRVLAHELLPHTLLQKNNH